MVTSMKRFALVILLPVLLLYGCYSLFNPTYSWHQKLTLVVETPEGSKTGASVVGISVTFRAIRPLPSIPVSYYSYRGEATVVDLGDGRYLFALLKGSVPLARKVFRDQLPGGTTVKSKPLLREIVRLKGVGDVPLPHAPLLVTFGDLSDPASVMRVDPANLAATFGAGFALREITLEVTEDAVTEGVVEGVLGWVDDSYYRKNPVWASLPNLVQQTITGLKVPAGENQ